MVERSLSMREVRGSIPRCSKVSFCLFFRVRCARPLTPRRSRHASAGPVESRAVAGVASEVIQTPNIHEVRFCQVPAPSSAAEDGADLAGVTQARLRARARVRARASSP